MISYWRQRARVSRSIGESELPGGIEPWTTCGERNISDLLLSTARCVPLWQDAQFMWRAMPVSLVFHCALRLVWSHGAATFKALPAVCDIGFTKILRRDLMRSERELSRESGGAQGYNLLIQSVSDLLSTLSRREAYE